MGGGAEEVHLVAREHGLNVELLDGPRLDLSSGVGEKTHVSRFTMESLNGYGVVNPDHHEHNSTLYYNNFVHTFTCTVHVA